jgi:nucleotide-binding universal stress UspA family protein
MDQPIDATLELSDARPRIVVGIDGSPGARTALVEAHLVAARRGADLQVVTSYTMELYWFGGEPLDVPDVETVRQDAERRARALLDEVRDEVAVSAVPGIREVGADLVVVQGTAAHVLVEWARGADRLVVGSRGRGAARSALLGSVALHCATHASCPVLVVHAETVAVSDPPKVVVGVDGSDAARTALATAIEEAAARGADLDAVATFQVTNYWTDLAGLVVPSLEQIRDELYRRTEGLVTSLLAGRPLGAPTPNVEIVVAEGAPGDVLVQRGRSADLLVVGSRGHGAFRGLLLGSVALHCAMHAPCPVLVVHSGGMRVTTPSTAPEAVGADR